MQIAPCPSKNCAKNGASVTRHTDPKTLLHAWDKLDIDTFSFCTKTISFAK